MNPYDPPATEARKRAPSRAPKRYDSEEIFGIFVFAIIIPIVIISFVSVLL